MNLLFGIYEFSNPIVLVQEFLSGSSVLETDPEVRVLMAAVVTSACTAGIAFYLRFLVALCRESSPRRFAYWVRLRSNSGEDTVTKLQDSEDAADRAA